MVAGSSQSSPREELKTGVRRGVRKVAERLGLKVEFVEVKRQTDITFATFFGPRQHVLLAPFELLKRFPEHDLELIRSEGFGHQFHLTLVVTERLTNQPTHQPERRAKLRESLRRLSEGEGHPIG